VDDEDSLRELGANVLTTFGYEVLTAANGRGGLEVYTRNKDRISLCILDLVMPEMDGKQCLQRILRMEPDAKVLIATGYDSNGFLEQALAKGAKGSLS
jgi:two-component system, cell cycle sensor histidine kinase and response regulator CckA